jgi:hypothetical protein
VYAYLWLKPQAILPYPSGIEKVNVRIMETTELNIMRNPACLAISSRHEEFKRWNAGIFLGILI